jgi:predicted nucleic acid-binding protein
LLDALSEGWIEVVASNAVRGAAERAVAVHSLRAADALQLAAAITWRSGDPAGAGFVCLDERLADAASREGFSVQ